MTSVVSKRVKQKTEYCKKNVGKVFFNTVRATNCDRGKSSDRECCGRRGRIGIDCVLAGMWKLRAIRKKNR